MRQSELDKCSPSELAEHSPLALPSTRQNLFHLRNGLGLEEAVTNANGGINSSIFDFMVAFEIQTLEDLVQNPCRYEWLTVYRHKSDVCKRSHQQIRRNE